MKKLILLVVLVTASVSTYSQSANFERRQSVQTKREQITAQRSAFITGAMGITPEKAEIFLPVYYNYIEELRVNRKYAPKSQGFVVEGKSDVELKTLMDGRFKMLEEELRIEKKYYLEFQRILTLQELAKLYRAEEQFKKEILNELKRRR